MSLIDDKRIYIAGKIGSDAAGPRHFRERVLEAGWEILYDWMAAPPIDMASDPRVLRQHSDLMLGAVLAAPVVATFYDRGGCGLFIEFGAAALAALAIAPKTIYLVGAPDEVSRSIFFYGAAVRWAGSYLEVLEDLGIGV